MSEEPKVPSPHVATGKELDAWAESFGVPPRRGTGAVGSRVGVPLETDDSLRKRILAKVVWPSTDPLRDRATTIVENWKAAQRLPTYDELKRALTLAVCMLAPHEPGDSRAVSEEFVALACLDCGTTSGRVMEVVDGALARLRDRPFPDEVMAQLIPVEVTR